MKQRPRNRPPDPSIILRITKNDRRIFLALQRRPGCPMHILARLLGYNPVVITHDDGRLEIRFPSLRRRLSQLRDADYIYWPPGSTHCANHRYKPACYANRPKAEAELRKHNEWEPSHGLSNDFAHDFGTIVVPASFELGTMADRRFRFIRADEILNHKSCPPKTRTSDKPFDIPVEINYKGRPITIVKKHDGPPWGIAFAKPEGGERKGFFFLEFDRDTEPGESTNFKRSSVTKHLRHILALLANDCAGYRKHLGLTRVYVLIVTINPGRAEQIKRHIHKLTNGRGSKRIGVKHIPDFMSYDPFPPATGHMLTEPWPRVGYPPLVIPDALEAKEKKAAA